MKIAEIVSERASCFRGKKVGAVLVRNRQIVSTGYNGAPKGVKNCLELDSCIRDEKGLKSGEQLEYCRAAHAEANAIAQAAVNGVSTKGAVLYSTHQPCVLCLKLIINAEIAEVVFQHLEEDRLAPELLKDSTVKMKQFIP